MHFKQLTESLALDMIWEGDPVNSAWLVNDFIFVLQKTLAAAFKESGEIDPNVRLDILGSLIHPLEKAEQENFYNILDKAQNTLETINSCEAQESADAIERLRQEFQELSTLTVSTSEDGAELQPDVTVRIIADTIKDQLFTMLEVSRETRLKTIQTDIEGMPAVRKAIEERASHLKLLTILLARLKDKPKYSKLHVSLGNLQAQWRETTTDLIGYRPTSKNFSLVGSVEGFIVNSQYKIEPAIDSMLQDIFFDAPGYEEAGSLWEVDALYLAQLSWKLEALKKVGEKDSTLVKKAEVLIKGVNDKREQVQEKKKPLTESSLLIQGVEKFIKNDVLKTKTFGEKNWIVGLSKKILFGLAGWLGFKRRPNKYKSISDDIKMSSGFKRRKNAKLDTPRKKGRNPKNP